VAAAYATNRPCTLTAAEQNQFGDGGNPTIPAPSSAVPAISSMVVAQGNKTHTSDS
jgi:hypothetical protein